MKYGIREICDVVFKAKTDMKIGNKTFHKGRPVLYIDSAKTSTIEGAATTVYAQGGRGNSRLIAWEGEKTLTFTVEDALLSPISFSMLSGAGVIQKEAKDVKKVHTHLTTKVVGVGAAVSGATENNRTKLQLLPARSDILTLYANAQYSIADADYEALSESEKQAIQAARDTIDGIDGICTTAPIFVYELDDNGEIIPTKIAVTPSINTTYSANWKVNSLMISDTSKIGKTFFVDCYVLKAAKVTELQIDAENFAGSFYVEASTLFREKSTGVDRPAEITFPNVKIQSNFTFSMASSGDPSTFTFTMDAMPGYTYFDKTKEVLCVMQIIEDESTSEKDLKSVMSHNEGTTQIVLGNEDWTDSYPSS